MAFTLVRKLGVHVTCYSPDKRIRIFNLTFGIGRLYNCKNNVRTQFLRLIAVRGSCITEAVQLFKQFIIEIVQQFLFFHGFFLKRLINAFTYIVGIIANLLGGMQKKFNTKAELHVFAAVLPAERTCALS